MKRVQLKQQWLLCYFVASLVVIVFHLGTLFHLNTEIIGDASGDMPGYHLSVLSWVQQTLQSGHFPIWNPLIFCGYPQWAEGQLSIIGPIGPLLLILPLNVAINLWWIILHILIALSAIWWLASYRVAPVSALFGGLSVALSGMVVMRMAGGHPNIVACYLWGFILAGAWNRWWIGKGRRLLILTAVAWAFLLLSAHIQTAYHFILWWGLLTIVSQGILNKRSFLRWLKGIIFVIVVGSLASAILLFPQIGFGLISPRTTLSIYESSTFNFPLENLLTLIFPGCFGQGLTATSSETVSPYLGRWYHIWENSLILNPLILIFLFLPRQSRHRNVVRGLWITSLIIFLLALGRQMPIFQIAYNLLPGFKMFRCHSRLIAFVLFGIIALATLAFDNYLRRSHTIHRRGKVTSPPHYLLMKIGFLVSVICLILILLAHRFPNTIAGSIVRSIASSPLAGPSFEQFPKIPEGTYLEYFWEKPEPSIRAQVFIRAGIPAISVWIFLLILGLLALRTRIYKKLITFLLLFVSFCFCFWLSLPYALRTDTTELKLSPKCVETLRSLTRSGRALLLGAGDRNLLLRHNIPSVGGYAALIGRRQNTLLQSAFNHPNTTQESQNNVWELTPQANWLGISAFVSTDSSISLPDKYKIVYTDDKIRVWDVQEPTPLAWVTSGGIAVSSYEESVALLQDFKYAENKQIILETSEPVKRDSSLLIPLSIKRPSPTEIRIDLSGASPGWVIILESFLPGWKAWVDGSSVPIIPAQVAFQAIKIGEGAKELKMVYRPLSFLIGIFISLLILPYIIFEIISKRKGGAWHSPIRINIKRIKKKGLLKKK